MLVIRLSPHRDARPRHISKPVCVCVLVCICVYVCVCVLLLYQCGYIYNWNEAQHVIWLLPLLPIVFWVAALGPSWGLQHDAAVAICGVYVFSFFAFLFCRRHQRGQLAACRAINVSIIICALSILQRRSFVLRWINELITFASLTKVKDIKDLNHCKNSNTLYT